MDIKIQSRTDIEEMARKPFDKRTALISITDFGYDFAELKHKPRHLLRLAFDDVDNDIFEDELSATPTDEERVSIEKRYHMFTDDLAKQIAEFYYKTCNDVEVFICQCEHGQSRSAAVASAILEHLNGNGIDIFANDHYYPNKVVYRKTLQQLRTKR